MLSLVSYILLAITLLLCLSCFARVLIQWSVRSSLAELHRGVTSPSGSFRSPSRFFSFLGTTLSTRWERPPPTYDEAMKHINPDLVNQPPPNPPAYSDTMNGRSSIISFSTGRRRLGRGYLRRHRSSSSSIGGNGGNCMIQTPPPEYQSQESGLHRLHLELDLEDVHNPLTRNTNEFDDSSVGHLDSNRARNSRRSRNDTRQPNNRRGNPIAASRSMNRIRYARYDRNNRVMEASENEEVSQAELSSATSLTVSTDEPISYSGLLSKLPQNPNVIILPPARPSSGLTSHLLSNASFSSSSLASPDSDVDINIQNNSYKIRKEIVGYGDGISNLSRSSPTQNLNSGVTTSDNQVLNNEPPLSPRLDEGDGFQIGEKDDDDILDDVNSDPTFASLHTSLGSSMISMSALSNSAELIFSDSFGHTPSSPGSAHSHHSYDSNLSSSSEASVKTVVRVNSTTIEAEICVNEET